MESAAKSLIVAEVEKSADGQTAAEISAATGLSISTCSKWLLVLAAEGKLLERRFGNTRAYFSLAVVE